MAKLVKDIKGAGYKKIGVYGGSFNPITYSHIMTLVRCVEFLDVDCIIIEPVGDCYDKAGLQKYNTRRILLMDAIKSVIDELNVDIHIGEFENKEGYYQPTSFITMNHYNEILEDAELTYICGADVLERMSTWEDGDNLVNSYNIACVDRVELGHYIEFDIINKSPLLFKRRRHITIVPAMTFNSISSSLVRNRVKCDMPIVGLVPPSIIKRVKQIYK